MNAISTKLFSICRCGDLLVRNHWTERTDGMELSGTYCEEGWRIGGGSVVWEEKGKREEKRWRVRRRRDASAAGGCARYYEGLTRGGGLVGDEWRVGGGRGAESIKSNVWWRYNEMNLCRAVMPEYLATLFWFCSWPDRHPIRYTVFELNSTTGPPLQGLKRPQSG